MALGKLGLMETLYSVLRGVSTAPERKSQMKLSMGLQLNVRLIEAIAPSPSPRSEHKNQSKTHSATF